MLKRLIRILECVPPPLVILITCIIAYGPLISSLGFYWDDLPNMWVNHMFGADGFITYASNHRPFSAWVFIITTPILGENPLGYHVLALILRWAGAVGVWWTLKQLWPAARKQQLWAALLFAIYPGFRELSIATVFNVHLMCLLLTFFSFGGMLWAFRKPRWFWLITALSVIAGAVSVFTMEYFIALELLRPVLLYLMFRNENEKFKPALLRAIRFYLSYLAILVLYGLWRLLIFKFPYYEPVLIEANQPVNNWFATILSLISEALYKAGILAWLNPFIPSDYALLGSNMRLLFWFILIGSTILTLVLLVFQKSNSSESNMTASPDSYGWSLQAITLGLLALLLAGWPLWIAGLRVDLGPLDSRFTLPFIFGSVLLLVGLINLLPGRNAFKMGAVSLLVGISCAWHLQATNLFRYEWEIFKDIFWQLTWRAPALKPGTALLSNDIPLQYYSDNSLTAMLNWTYAPESNSLDMPYLLDFISVRLGAGLPALENGLPLTQDYSTLSFTSSTDETIAIFAMPPSCLRLLDRKLDDNYQRLPKLSGEAANISNLGQIQFYGQAVPPINIFKKEPPPDWCYYFEKADLARQQGDWESIVRFGDAAFGLNDNPNEASERLPFIEAYAHVGQWDRALEISRVTIAHGKEGVLTMLCNTWARIEETTTSGQERDRALQIIQSEYNCQLK